MTLVRRRVLQLATGAAALPLRTLRSIEKAFLWLTDCYVLADKRSEQKLDSPEGR
jgi:hypothetical protein